MVKKSKQVRQIDIARKAGVHQSTVSVVLGADIENQESINRIPVKTISLIRKIAAESGYKPNRSALELRGQRSCVIGMLMQPPGRKYFDERFARLLVMEQTAYKRGYRVIIGHLFNPRQQIRDYVEDFQSRRVEGVLCLAHDLGDQSRFVTEQLSVLPNVVYFNKPAANPRADFVGTDYSDGMEQIISHLVSKGRRKIGIALMGKKYYPMIERFKGYQNGLKKAGIDFDEKKVWLGPEKVVLTNALIQQILTKLVDTAKVDAIIAADDEWGYLLMKELLNRGIKVPDDTAIVGYDNLSISPVVNPGLTTVDCKYELIGQKMIEMLFNLIEKPNSDKTILAKQSIVRPKLIIRAST